MATITLRPDVYDKAAIFARKDKLNIEDYTQLTIDNYESKYFP